MSTVGKIIGSAIFLIFVVIKPWGGLFDSSARGDDRKPIHEQIQLDCENKSEVIAAFEAIAQAIRAHNTVFLERVESEGPVNGPSFRAGIEDLDRSGRELGGVAKQIVDAVATTWVYEKSLFVPFDTMRDQASGMATWSTRQSTYIRGHIQIIDEEIRTYERAIVYLQRGEEPLLRQNFESKRVPREISEEFLRLRRTWGKEVREYNLGMFTEDQKALESYRAALSASNAAAADQYYAEAQQHLNKSNSFRQKMIAALRESLAGSIAG